MTRRTFVEASALLGSMPLLGLAGCAPAVGGSTGDASDANGSAGQGATATPKVFFSRDIDSEAIQEVYAAMGRGIGEGRAAVKLSTGEPGSNYLKVGLIEGLVKAVGGTIVECNTAYSGQRSSSESHYKVAEDHGFTSIAPFLILDEEGEISLPVENGFHLKENLVGARITEFSGLLVLSHFKGHAMAGFGGAIKNLSIGLASAAGKCRIHTAGASDERWTGGSTPEFQESMADAAQSVIRAFDGNVLYINVMNRLSVDCDCVGHPAEPKMADVGVLASVDPVALDQACVDLVYSSNDDKADLVARIESLDGEHVLEAAEQLGVGSRAYELVEM